MCFGFVFSDFGNGKSIASNANDFGFGRYNILSRRKCDANIVCDEWKCLVKRRDNAIDYGNNIRKLFGVNKQWIVCFGFICNDICNGKSIANNANDFGFGCNHILPRRERYANVVCYKRKCLVKRRNNAINHGNYVRKLFGFGK